MSRISRLIPAFAIAILAGCGNGTVIGGGGIPTPAPSVSPNVSFEYSVPTANAGPATLAAGPDGYVYFTEESASKIARVSTGGTFGEIATTTASAGPLSIIVGPDSEMWFTENTAGKIAKMTTAFAATDLTEYTIPWGGSTPAFLSRGVPSGVMYFTDPATNAIGQVATDGTFNGPFAIPTANANPQGIAIGPDNKMWFTETNASKIGILDPTTNAISEVQVTAGSKPTAIVEGSDGAMWFTENIAGGAKLGRMTTQHQYTEYALTGANSATGLTVDLFGNLAITDTANSTIGVFTLSGQTFKEYATKTASAGPQWIVIGPDGKLYFTEFAADKIGQFTYF